jgi:hypothetical protein
MPDDAVGLLFNEITAERGGQQSFSVVELSLARQLAVMLSEPTNKADPAIVTKLLEMLPAKSTEPPADLSRLSDAQFNQLEKLLAVTRGQAAPRPLPRKPPPKPLTSRGNRAAELANLLDRVENEGRALCADDLLQARNCISAIMFPLGTLTTLLPAEIFATPSPPLEVAPQPKELEEQAPPPAPTPAFDNVVPMPLNDEQRSALKYGAVFISGTGGMCYGDNTRR